MGHLKTWLTDGEWAAYSNCPDLRWITPPERLSEEDVNEVQYRCNKCMVRAECIKDVVDNQSSGVYCASVWIPEVGITDTPRRAKAVLEEAEKIRGDLARTIPDELKRRGEF